MVSTYPHRTALDSTPYSSIPGGAPAHLKQRALKDLGMELLLLPHLAMIGALVGLVALVLVFLRATRPAA